MGVELMAAAVALSAIGTYNQIETTKKASEKQD